MFFGWCGAVFRRGEVILVIICTGVDLILFRTSVVSCGFVVACFRWLPQFQGGDVCVRCLRVCGYPYGRVFNLNLKFLNS